MLHLDQVHIDFKILHPSMWQIKPSKFMFVTPIVILGSWFQWGNLVFLMAKSAAIRLLLRQERYQSYMTNFWSTSFKI